MGVLRQDFAKTQFDSMAEQVGDLRGKLKDLGVESAEIGISIEGGRPFPVVKSFTIADAAIAKVAQASPGNIQEVAASQLQIINSYYQSVLQQAQQSFKWALIAAGVGLLFFLAAIGFVLVVRDSSVSNLSLISGALIEVISAINFYLYARASDQLSAFHNRLERTQRFLLANSVCENLDGETKQSARAELVRVIATPS